MKLSQNGMKIIKFHEGLRLEKYLCASGKPTIGYGHHIKAGETYEVITIEEAEKIFKKDVTPLETTLSKIIDIELNDDQFSATLSFVYNWGIGNFIKSKALKYLNRGDINAFVKESFEDVNLMKASGTIQEGLIKRRIDERRLFYGLPLAYAII